MINRINKKITLAHTRPAPNPPLTYWIYGATYDDVCVVWVHSSVDIDSHKLSSWKVVHQYVLGLTCSHWWTTFQLLSLWLSMLTGLWPQTTHASLCRPGIGSSRFHNFYASQLYRAYVTTCCHVRRLCRVVKRPLQSLHWYNCLLERGSLVTSHVYFNQSISDVTFDLAWLWKIRGQFTLVRSTLYLH